MQHAKFPEDRLFKNMQAGLIYYDSKGRIIRVNPAAEQILGYAAETLYAMEPFTNYLQAVREDGTPLSSREYPPMQALTSGKPIEPFVIGIIQAQTQKRKWIVIDAVPEFKKGDRKSVV